MTLTKETWPIRQMFRLNEISKIENYSNPEINQRKLCSKKLSKYATAFDYIDKVLNILSTKSGGFCIVLSVSGIAGGRFNLIFSLTTGIIKKLLRNKKQKEQETKRKSMIRFLCWLKVTRLHWNFSISSIDWLGNKSGRL